MTDKIRQSDLETVLAQAGVWCGRPDHEWPDSQTGTVRCQPCLGHHDWVAERLLVTIQGLLDTLPLPIPAERHLEVKQIRRRDEEAVTRLGKPDDDPLLRAQMDRRALLVILDALPEFLYEWGIVDRYYDENAEQSYGTERDYVGAEQSARDDAERFGDQVHPVVRLVSAWRDA